MRNLIYLFILISPFIVFGQQQFAGSYEGTLNGDRIELTLTEIGKGKFSGKMTDSANRYDVSGTADASSFRGKAIEKNLGITFDMVATNDGNSMPTTLSIDVFGEIQKMEIQFKRVGSKTSETNNSKVINPVASKTKDSRVVGTWVKESNYSSGYGDAYGSMSVSERMEFLPDGTMAEGGSQAVVGGSNYTGTSTSSQKKILEGVFWYTENQKIFLFITQGGQSQTSELGKYFIENNKMLITGSNGQKLLLSKR